MTGALAVLALLLTVAVRAQDLAGSDANTLSTPMAGPSAASPLTLAGYRSALERIAVALERGELEAARTAADALRGATVELDGGSFEADPTVVEAAASAHDAAAAARGRLRIRRALASFDDAGGPGGGADAALLDRLAREEAARRPAPGGDVDASLDLRQPNVPEQLRAWLDRAVSRVAELVGRLWRWLTRGRSPRGREAQSGLTQTAVALLVAAIFVLLAVFAARSLRRRDAPAEVAGPAEAVTARDEDPLSREANEWERYAAELAAARRWREAIRAWYHAVLVTLFRAGRLHHQKGRTNWEYASQVGPEVRWRPAFIDLTRAFDREWYGRSASAAESLRECVGRAREVLRAVREDGGG